MNDVNDSEEFIEEIENGELVFLRTANDVMQADMIETSLKANEISIVKVIKGTGAYVKVCSGQASVFGVEL